MKTKWEFNDYIVIILIVIFIFSFCYSCSRDSEKSHQEAIEAAYTEGYEAGWYDYEHGNDYHPER